MPGSQPQHPLTFGQRRDYYRESVASKTALVDLLRDKNYHKLADNARIDVYTGEGSFASPETVAVKTTQGTQQIGGKYIVINTGAETVIPPIEGIAQSRRSIPAPRSWSSKSCRSTW